MECCKYCNTKISDNFRKIEGVYSCKSCYDDISWELRKGYFTVEEGEQTSEFLKKYFSKVSRIVLGMSKKTLYSDLKWQEVVTDVVTTEEGLSLELFNKVRDTIDKHEHYEIINRVIDIKGFETEYNGRDYEEINFMAKIKNKYIKKLLNSAMDKSF